MTTRAFLGQFDALTGRVVDGDTLDLIFNLGLGIVVTGRVRLFAINAPELSAAGPEGETAREFLKSLLPLNTLVRAEVFTRDKFGRFVSEIFRTLLDGTVKNVSQEMLDAAHAVPFEQDVPNQFLLSPFPGFISPPTPLFLGGAQTVFIGGVV